MASLSFTYSPEEKTVLFFRHVKKELGIPATKDLVHLVRKILSHLRRGLSNSQLTRLVNHLPGVFQLMVAYPDQEVPSHPENFSHLDELVESIYAEDKKSSRSIFATEVEALNAVIVVLQKLDKYVNLFSYNILKYPVVKELRQIPIEDAA